MSGQEKKKKGLGESRKSSSDTDRNTRVSSRQGLQQTNSTDDANKNHPKIDKSGLYDLQQVKRLLDDEVISVSVLTF